MAIPYQPITLPIDFIEEDSTNTAKYITYREAKELGVTKEELQIKNCKFCGKELQPIGLYMKVLDRWKWYHRGSYEDCDCPEAVEYRKKIEEELARERAERERREKERAYREKIERLLKESKLGERFKSRTFENFEITKKNKFAYEIAKKYADEFEKYLKSGLGLMFTGSYGAGKTHLAAAICHELIKKGFQPIFGTMITLLEKIKATYDEYALENEEQIINKYLSCDLLIIDDLGKEKPSEWALEKLYYIINSRYEAMKPVVITSNYDIERLKVRLTLKDNSETAEAIISRLYEMCRGVHLDDEDYRKKI